MNIQLDDIRAQKLAAPFKMGPEDRGAPDPCPDIPPSLLSADHIIEYVSKTGMIAPFDGGKYDKSPLKAASYESKIGKNAYIFDKGINYPRSIFDGTQDYLEVPANSIVFVESGIYFRLPSFIAVRFNLQINHVHRGLLLGTGPLVDPGFWGRLCIPLHNLTNEPYLIPRDEGLIWVEFTKTSSTPNSGRPPSNTEFPDIKKFIEKASKPFVTDAAPIAIRSSIPDMVEKANESSREAAISAAKSETAVKRLSAIGIFSLVIGAVSVFTLAATIEQVLLIYKADYANGLDNVRASISASDKNLREHIVDVNAFGKVGVEAGASISSVQQKLERQDQELKRINSELIRANSEIDKIKKTK